MRRVVVLLALAGCNGLLGIDGTAPSSSDGDHDGVADRDDNCPGLANGDQADADDDDIGDVCDPSPNGLACAAGTPIGEDIDEDSIDDGCDPCLRGSPHDEDHDGLADGCDVCPGTADPLQERFKDLDTIGDACDLGPSLSVRVAYDGFGKAGAPSSLWLPAETWMVSEDAVVAMGGAERLALRSGIGELQGTSDGSWFVDTHIRLPATLGDGQLVGIDLPSSDSPKRGMFCGIRYDAGPNAWKVYGVNVNATEAKGADIGTVAGTVVELRVRYHKTGSEVGITCEVPTVAAVTVVDAFVANPLLPALRADAAATFLDIDVVR